MEQIEIEESLIRTLVIGRRFDSRKGDNGIVLVIGGGRLYHGAPILTSIAALRTGTDLVYTAVPKSITLSIRSTTPDLIVIPMADEKLTMGSGNRLVAKLPKIPNAAIIGMGLSISTDKSLENLIINLLGKRITLLLDANALVPNIIPHIYNTHSILTPHAGEFRRLFNLSLPNNLDERCRIVKMKAKENGLIIVLKGETDIISDGERVFTNKIHSCAMTVGGTGDVLAGIIGGLLTKMNPLDASVTGIFLNGKAGIVAYNKFGLHIIASDLISLIPDVMKAYDKIIT